MPSTAAYVPTSPSDETDRLLEAIDVARVRTLAADPRSAAARENARLAVEHDPVRLELERWRESDERRASIEFVKAMRLAGPQLDVFEALLRGERVPRSKLDPIWLKAYGL